MSSLFERVIWIVLDGVGVGALPDAADYQDEGSNTLGNLSHAFFQKVGRPLRLPHLEAWGLGNITPMKGISAQLTREGAFGRALELSGGKDTTSGHWEMAGLILKQPFATYPNGFSKEVVDRWISENQLPGILGNKASSGTQIISELGEEHLITGKPILYTSADSVWQVAAHEEAFGLEKLYSICQSARKICNELQIGRVIARPFIGNPAQGKPFQRTYHRKDYAQKPASLPYLDALSQAGVPTLGIGKISNIFAGRSIQANIDTSGNTDGISVLLEQIKGPSRGLIFCNLIDFDMLYGHRRDIVGFGNALEEFDQAIPEMKKSMKSTDLLIIASDHGNDPTFRGTDHTREYIPLISYTSSPKSVGPVDLGIRKSFADVGATVAHALLGEISSQMKETPVIGTSWIPEIMGHVS